MRTGYLEVDTLLSSLQRELEPLLGTNFVGMYLYGSLVTGDFSLVTSDIDTIIVTKMPIDSPVFASLQALHRTLCRDHAFALKLEGSYVPLPHPSASLTPEVPCPSFNEGEFYWGTRGAEWTFIRHILREQRSVITGEAPIMFLPPPLTQELQQATRALFREWWEPMLTDAERLQSAEYRLYATFTLCRMLYTLHEERLTSKRQAIHWALGILPPDFRPLLSSALAWRSPNPFASVAEVQSLLHFVSKHV